MQTLNPKKNRRTPAAFEDVVRIAASLPGVAINIAQGDGRCRDRAITAFLKTGEFNS